MMKEKHYKEFVQSRDTDDLIDRYRLLMDALLIPNDGSRKYRKTLKKILILCNLIEEELRKRGIKSIGRRI